MFGSIQSEVDDRILESMFFVDSIDERDPSKRIATSTAKGLAFVQLYGVYEYAVRHAVQAALLHLEGSGAFYAHVRRETLALALNPMWDSCAEVGAAERWNSRIKILQTSTLEQPIGKLDVLAFPTDGSHYRPRQLLTIWSVLGLTCATTPHPRHLSKIAELVENRNAIAHGRRTALDVGSGYSKADVLGVVNDIHLVCLHVVESVRAHVEGGSLLQLAKTVP